MARNIVNPAGKPAIPSQSQQSKPMAGGAGGVAEDPNPVAHHVGGARVNPMQTRRANIPAQPQRIYRVTGGPPGRKSDGNPDPGSIQVMYDGALTRIQLGREYTEHQVDIPFLKRAGVKLEVIFEPPPPAEAEVAAEGAAQ